MCGVCIGGVNTHSGGFDLRLEVIDEHLREGDGEDSPFSANPQKAELKMNGREKDGPGGD